MKIHHSIVVFLSKIIANFIFVFVVIPYRIIRELIKYPKDTIVGLIGIGIIGVSVFSILYFICMFLFYIIPQLFILWQQGYI